ncbi:oligoendopeptidase F [Bacillus luteolus]|uniref:Oligopeptidase F n=1 Tax=Litchfieldia luteola TaxID=682179 RepID=A0ABR9QNA5_9BACI|nr:oligoendopeptidase F [Cytobacillus luteolus]MBE4909983.1 oligoendopeptidase F [Cytobacillus luteolus]MBP1942458.1 oligoendopeptidase F [Cytobacillus luteolus]
MSTTFTKLPKRNEISEEYTWRLEDMFATDQEWEKQFTLVKDALPSVSKFKGTLKDSAENIVNLFKLQDDLSIKLGQLATYAFMRNDQDTTNSLYQGLKARIDSLVSQFSAAFSFVVPELLSIPENTLLNYIDSHEELKVYEHLIKDINRARPHVLSAEEEALLAQVADVTSGSRTTFSMLNNADLKFPSIETENGDTVEITHGRYGRLMESTDRRIRKETFLGLNSTYNKHRNTLASTLSGQVKKDNFFATVHGYESARQAALHKHNIPESVYDTLIETVGDHLHLLQRYISLRKKILGVAELNMFDLSTPLVQDVKMEVSYEEAKDLVIEGMKPLGEEYGELLKTIFSDRRIDVYENVGKRSGAYSTGAYGAKPYILMNWQDNIRNVFTLAHELGHNVHRYYTQNYQPFAYGKYSTFVAEVASTANEALLNDYLLKITTDQTKQLYLLNNYLQGFVGTVFRQTLFAEFEHKIHILAQNGEPLTADTLSALYYDLNKKYFGDEINVNKEIEIEWARIPHFYMTYYVFQYATGFSAATALSKQILEEGAPAVERYTDFLKAGCSDYPIEVLKKAGVDMTTAEPIKEALKVFEEKLEYMESILLK